MVFFVCSSCGASLKKNQVEKHWLTKCRHNKHVSCMDCSKDFRGQEYADHVKCVTEDQKYGGSQYVAKEMKGEKKQEAWIAKIKEQVANTHNMEPQLKELLDRITTFSNIPRKKEKFVRFLNNSARIRHSHIVDKAWEVFEAARKNNNNKTQSQNGQVSPAAEPASATLNDSDCPDAAAQDDDDNKSSLSKREKKKERQKKQGKKEKKDRTSESTEVVEKPSKRKREEDKSNNEAGESKKRKKHLEQAEATSEETQEKKKKKKKKRKLCGDEDLSLNENHTQNTDDDHDTVNNSTGETSGFKWKVAIARVLQDAPEQGMKMTKLQRKILSLYFTANSESSHMKSENEVTAILKNKLKKRNDKYIVCNDRVMLRTH